MSEKAHAFFLLYLLFVRMGVVQIAGVNGSVDFGDQYPASSTCVPRRGSNFALDAEFPRLAWKFGCVQDLCHSVPCKRDCVVATADIGRHYKKLTSIWLLCFAGVHGKAKSESSAANLLRCI